MCPPVAPPVNSNATEQIVNLDLFTADISLLIRQFGPLHINDLAPTELNINVHNKFLDRVIPLTLLEFALKNSLPVRIIGSNVENTTRSSQVLHLRKPKQSYWTSKILSDLHLILIQLPNNQIVALNCGKGPVNIDSTPYPDGNGLIFLKTDSHVVVSIRKDPIASLKTPGLSEPKHLLNLDTIGLIFNRYQKTCRMDTIATLEMKEDSARALNTLLKELSRALSRHREI